MRSLILSDIHSNWEGLRAVLTHAAGAYDEIVCCGDVVGYNCNPAEVVDWARTHCARLIRGNHDKVVCGIDGLEDFNPAARAAARWTRMSLASSDLAWLRELPAGPLVGEHFTLLHGSPFDEDEYVVSNSGARECFPYLTTAVSFFGHTHLQGVYSLRQGRIRSARGVGIAEEEAVLELEPDTLYMVNPGSVGQPRDGDNRAGYAIFDSAATLVTLRRTQYDVAETARKILAAGLPDSLALRLFDGS